METVISFYKEAEKYYKARRLEESLAKYDFVVYKCENLLKTRPTIDVAGESRDLAAFLAESYNNRGLVRYKLVDFKEAVEDYTKALSHKPDMTVAFYNRGLIHYRLGRYRDAIVDMKMALQLDPEFVSAKQCLEQCLKEELKQ